MMHGNGMDENDMVKGIMYACTVKDAGDGIPEIQDAVPNWNDENLGCLGCDYN